MSEMNAGLPFCNNNEGGRDGMRWRSGKGGVARRVVGQERPGVLADGVFKYYMYAKHRDVSHTYTQA